MVLSDFIGYFYPSIFILVLIILGLISFGLPACLQFVLITIPLYFGCFYYAYAHHSIFGNELERIFTTPLTLLLSILTFPLMLVSGGVDARKAIENDKLPVVIFEQQTSYPNERTDWRLLESIDTRFVLINLKNKWNDSYEIKVVENTKIDSIY